MEAALYYLSLKPRTILETELYLDTKDYSDFEISSVIERLKELGYLDDEKYAKDFIISRLNTKPVSKRKLTEQLYSHRIPKETIEAAVGGVSQEEEKNSARLVCEKYMRQFEKAETKERAEMTAKRMSARGFSYGDIKEAIQEYLDIDLPDYEE